MNLNEAKQQAYSAAHRAASKMKEIMPMTMTAADAAELSDMAGRLHDASYVLFQHFFPETLPGQKTDPKPKTKTKKGK